MAGMLSTHRMHYPKLTLPVRFYLAGCSQSGKSSLLKAMIENMEALFERPFTRIIIARRAVDELHLQLQRAYPDLVELVTGMPSEFLDNIEEQIRPGDNVLLIFDDLISIVAESREAENAFYVSSSKFGVSIVLTSQNIFHRSAKLRNISLNCNLIGLTQNLRDATQVTHLARQLYPDNPEFLIDAYRKTMRLKPFNYLLINLQPLCDDRLRVLTGVLPHEDRIYWLPKRKLHAKDGKTVTNVDEHIVVRVCDEKRMDSIVSAHLPSLKQIDALGLDAKWFEVHTRKRVIEHQLDTAFGAFVYQYAKLRLLQAYYDYLDFYWERRDYQLMYIDTDSLYFAISTHDLRSFNRKVREERRHLFDANYPEQFLAREDPLKYTPEEIAFDRRKAGLFHLETLASRMCALNAKTYVCTGIVKSGREGVVKQSAKGVTRALNHLEWSAYYAVLRSMKDFVGVSRTLRRPYGRQEVCRVDEHKRALTYGFYKRRLAEDGITTFPLGL